MEIFKGHIGQWTVDVLWNHFTEVSSGVTSTGSSVRFSSSLNPNLIYIRKYTAT